MKTSLIVVISVASLAIIGLVVGLVIVLRNRRGSDDVKAVEETAKQLESQLAKAEQDSKKKIQAAEEMIAQLKSQLTKAELETKNKIRESEQMVDNIKAQLAKAVQDKRSVEESAYLDMEKIRIELQQKNNKLFQDYLVIMRERESCLTDKEALREARKMCEEQKCKPTDTTPEITTTEQALHGELEMPSQEPTELYVVSAI